MVVRARVQMQPSEELHAAPLDQDHTANTDGDVPKDSSKDCSPTFMAQKTPQFQSV